MQGDSCLLAGLVLLKNMNDISNLATCSFFQHIKASAKYFVFKDLKNSSLPRGPKCDALIHKGLRYFISC